MLNSGHNDEFDPARCALDAAAKGRGPRTGPGHVKHMWCVRCREVTEHRQEE